MRLLKSLNKEYENKRIMSEFPHYDDKYQLEQANRRIDKLIREKMNFERKRILEIGCGGGYTIYQIAQRYNCEAVGVDIYSSPIWTRNVCNNLTYKCVDLSIENPFREEEFDYIISYVAWEHIKHPFEVLQQATKILKKDGIFYLYANLYRSAIASHLYRCIYFPFPHLLFEDDMVIKYALKHGTERWFIDAFYHLNKLTYAQYKEYFNLLELDVEEESKAIRNLDWEFYYRFEDKLGCYPISDLELDFFGVYLRKTSTTVIRKQIECRGVKVELSDRDSIGKVIQLSCEASGDNLKFAWYIFRNGLRIDTIWYRTDSTLEYVPKESGEYHIRLFVKDRSEKIKIFESERIRIE